MKTLLKVLDKNMRSPYRRMKYKIGVEYHCDDFNTSDKDCSNGFYATDWDGLLYAYRKGRYVWEVEVWGQEKEIDPFKRRYENIKLVRKLSFSEVKQGLKNASEKAGYDLYHASFPKNPLTGKPKRVAQKDIENLKEWASIRDSIRASIWDSIRDSFRDSFRDSIGASIWTSIGDSIRASIGASTWDSIRDSIGDSIGGSIWDSIWTSIGDSIRDSIWDSIWPSIGDSISIYISSLFPRINSWKYIDHNPGENPFQCGADLWNRGFVPSFDGNTWRLHSGKNAKIVYEWRKR